MTLRTLAASQGGPSGRVAAIHDLGEFASSLTFEPTVRRDLPIGQVLLVTRSMDGSSSSTPWASDNHDMSTRTCSLLATLGCTAAFVCPLEQPNMFDRCAA